MSDEIAKAVQETAKLGQQALSTAEKGGGWAASVFGESINNVAGALADTTAGFRMRNRIRVIEKTLGAIEAAGLTGKVRSLPDRLAFPVLEAISDESDETLQDVWASFIRNAADPRRPAPDRVLIDVIRRLEPTDWPLIEQLFRARAPAELVPDFLNIPEDDLIASLDRLAALGLCVWEDDHLGYLLTEDSARPRIEVKVSVGTYAVTRLLDGLRRSVQNVEP